MDESRYGKTPRRRIMALGIQIGRASCREGVYDDV